MLAAHLHGAALALQLDAVHEEDGRLVAVTIEAKDSKPQRLPTTALFVCIGGDPCTDWAGDSGLRATGVTLYDRDNGTLRQVIEAERLEPPAHRPHPTATRHRAVMQ